MLTAFQCHYADCGFESSAPNRHAAVAKRKHIELKHLTPVEGVVIRCPLTQNGGGVCGWMCTHLGMLSAHVMTVSNLLHWHCPAPHCTRVNCTSIQAHGGVLQLGEDQRAVYTQAREDVKTAVRRIMPACFR